MQVYDYIIIGVVAVLFIMAIIYIIKHRGCTNTQCQNCVYKNKCRKEKNKIN